MRRSTLAICALLTVATLGCEQVNTAKAKLKLAWDKLRGRPTATATTPPPARPAADTAAARVAAQRGDQPQRPRPPAAPQGEPLTRDVPYISDDTGTVSPGMTERDPADDGDATRLYVGVILCQIVTVAALWALGRIFG